MEPRREIKPGIYRHFKGNEYEVVDVARHSETEEELVVYRALYGDGGLWVRPFDMFCGKVDKRKYPDVEQEYRFERIADGLESGCIAAKRACPEDSLCAEESDRFQSKEGPYCATCEEFDGLGQCDGSSGRTGERSGLHEHADGVASAFGVDELAEAKRQFDSLIHKLEATRATLCSKDEPSRYKSQITLAERRIRACRIAKSLIEQLLPRVSRASMIRVGSPKVRRM
ncbi:MAG: DUF1653 domain-containing protein [Slackia sp.]|nr:DUF1653 domain-containing protein [Slackia sp.]